MLFRAIAMAGIAMAGTPALAASSFQGSDTLAGIMTDAITALGMENEIEYVGGGSGKGETAIVAGDQGIAPMSRPLKPEAIEKAKAKGIQLKAHVIALDGIGVFVNSGNPVAKVDFPTLEKIFTCKLTKWEDVPGSTHSGTIKVVRRNDNSGTTDTFKSLVGVKEFGACAKALPETADVAHATASDEDTIGFSGLTAGREGNKALQVAKTAGGAVYNPSVKNIRTGIYPLARKLYVYEASGAVTPDAAEAKLLKKLKDRSFLDPIVQDNDFYTLD